MISPSRDPGSMTDNDRLAEVAAILSLGYLRLQKSRKESRNQLDDLAESTAPCDHEVDGNSAVPRKEAI
jgi:hypothetical protein